LRAIAFYIEKPAIAPLPPPGFTIVKSQLFGNLTAGIGFEDFAICKTICKFVRAFDMDRVADDIVAIRSITVHHGWLVDGFTTEYQVMTKSGDTKSATLDRGSKAGNATTVTLNGISYQSPASRNTSSYLLKPTRSLNPSRGRLATTRTTRKTSSTKSRSPFVTLPRVALVLRVRLFFEQFLVLVQKHALSGPFGNGDRVNQGDPFNVTGPVVALAGSVVNDDSVLFVIYSWSNFPDWRY
jgi:hypothetical protein